MSLWIGTNWLTLAQGLFLQTICALSMIYIVISFDLYVCDYKESIRRTAKHRWNKSDSMYLG